MNFNQSEKEERAFHRGERNGLVKAFRELYCNPEAPITIHSCKIYDGDFCPRTCNLYDKVNEAEDDEGEYIDSIEYGGRW